MKYFISVLMLVMVLSLAGSSFAGNLLAGAGGNFELYREPDKFLNAAPIMLLGYGIETPSEGTFGQFIPDETYLIGQYRRAKDSLGNHTQVYGATLAGLWYLLDDSAKTKFSPFFVLRTNYKVEDQEVGGSVTYLTGQFGLGCGYPLSSKTDVWTAGTIEMGEYVSADLALGLRFKF